MWRHLVFASLLFVRAHTFAPAPIHGAGLPAKRYVLVPSALPKKASASGPKLMIQDLSGMLPSSKIPHFTANLDKTISWDGFCLQASRSELLVSRCTGEPSQLWIFLPQGHGRNDQIQLSGTNSCLDVVAEGNLNGIVVDLHECDHRTTELQEFERTTVGESVLLPTRVPSQRSSHAAFMRHAMIPTIMLALLGALSSIAWVWRWQSTRTVATIQATPEAHLPRIVPVRPKPRVPYDPQMGMVNWLRSRLPRMKAGEPDQTVVAQSLVDHTVTGGRRVAFDGMFAPAESRPNRIILVRHGESQGNLDESTYEATPDSKIELTDNGFLQGVAAGTTVRDLIGDESVTFFVSPYMRARQTFNAMLRAFEGQTVKLTTEPRLREQDFGNFQDKEQMSSRRQERQDFGRFFYRFPNGESGTDVYDRMASFITYMFRTMQRRDGERCENYVLVTHGLLMRFFCMCYLRWNVEEFEQVWNPTNGEVWVFERQPGHGHYEFLGRIVEDEKKREFKDLRFGKDAMQPMYEHMKAPLISRIAVPGTPDALSSAELNFINNAPGPSADASKTIDEFISNWKTGSH